MITSRIRRAGDAFIAEINGKPCCLYGYMTYQPQRADYAAFRAQGTPLLFIPAFAGDRGINPYSANRPFLPGFWKGEGEYDFSCLDETLRTAVGDGKPGEVFVIPRFMLEPPGWWEKAHPDALCRDYSGMSVHESFSSPVWLAATVQVMEAIQEWLTSSGWNAYIAGWHLAAAHTEEFMRLRVYDRQFCDYSECAVQAWRRYCREKYGTVEALNRAWGTRYADFELQPPTPAQRLYTADGRRLPMAADYYRFHSEEDARALNALAHEAKRITGGQRIIGAFYGYVTNDPEIGHGALDLVTACPDVDFLASPLSYPRPEAGEWILAGSIDSCALHGKPWFVECDVRTHLTQTLRECVPHGNPAGNSLYDLPVWHGPDTEERSLHQMKKAFAKSLTRGLPLWWFDMWGGWYRTPAYMAFQRRALELYRQEIEGDGFLSRAQVAVFRDIEAPMAYAHEPDGGTLLNHLSRSGAAFAQYTLRDLPLIDPARFRAAVILGARCRTNAEREALDAWRSEGRSILHVCGTLPEENPATFRTALSDGDVEVYGSWQQYRFPEMPEPRRLRECFLTAGVHLYSFTDDVLYAGGNIVALHALTDGEKRLYLPEKGKLEDAFTGEILENCDHLTDFSMKAGETRVFLAHTEV